MSDPQTTRAQPRRAGPIRVAAPLGERHILTGAVDARLVAEPAESGRGGDIVIIPMSRRDALSQAKADLTPKILRGIAKGKSVLVFDHSGEGPVFSVAWARQLHHFLKTLGVPPRRAVFITQNRDFAALYAAFARAAEVEPVRVLNYDLYIRDFVRPYANGAAVFAERLARFEQRAAVREKRFVCLNFSARPTKVLLLLKLLQGGEFERGFVSFPGFDAQRNARAVRKSAMTFDLLAIPGLEDIGAELSPWMDDLDRWGGGVLGPVRTAAGRPNHFKDVAGDMALEEYDRSWFSVITETEMHGSRRITEKPLKAMANFSPLIVLGNAFSLDLLREFGFRTFDGLIDESYDRERDPRRRFEAVYEEIRRLCVLPEARLREAEAAIADTLRFNARRVLVDMPALYRDVLEPRLIDRILDPVALSPRPAAR